MEPSLPLRNRPGLLLGALALFPFFPTAVAGPAEGGAQEAPPPSSPLPKEELAVRREALKNRIFEPMVLEAQSFRLAFERATSSFLIEDRRTGVGWHSALGRKGYATVILRDGGRKLPVDGVEDLRSEEKEIRFRGRSSAGELPQILFRLRVLGPLVGLELSFEMAPEAMDRVAAVRLLDDAPWVADADGGGALLPSGLGEWLPADSGPDFRRRFRLHDGPWSEKREDPEPAPMASLGLVRGGGGIEGNLTAALLLRFEAPASVLEVRREASAAPGFPGRSGLISSLVIAAPRGSVKLYPLGKGDAVDIAHSFRQLAQREKGVAGLRTKLEGSKAWAALTGAAILRPRVPEAGPGGASPAPYLQELARLCERWRRVLEIDQALVILSGSGARAPGVGTAGGEAESAAVEADRVVSAFARQLNGLGYLFGVELPGADRLEEALPRLKQAVAPDLVLLPPPADATGLAEKLQGAGMLLGIKAAGEVWAGPAVYLEGPLSWKTLHPMDLPSFPLFSFAYGNAARLAARPGDAAEPDQPEKILAHLVLGEVPGYALPSGAEEELERAGERWCLARGDGGWAEGKSLTTRERFVKNTFEVLSQVARIRFRSPLLFHRYLTPDRAVEETYFGPDLRVVVNYGEREFLDEESDFKLPRFGFWVQHPFFHAFHATRAHGVDYPGGALFTVRSLEGKMYLRAESVRIWHGFGPAAIRLGGRDFEVARESVVKIW